jgi:serine/threonine protein kinase
MTVPLDEFIRQLEETGILSAETLKAVLPPRNSPQDAASLARELVRGRKLTKFQADAIAHGNGKSLVLDNYILLEKIGQGGMGQVFKARQRRLSRTVAVKVLPPNLVKNPETITRFEREIRAAARINHPNIVTAFDAGAVQGIHFLVMEYVEGSDLARTVKRGGPLPVETAVDYVRQAACGLHAAHVDGIVHRDIKPANLLVDAKGTVKVLDLGLARFESERDSAAEVSLTRTGTVMGTIDFIAPEQAVDTKSADARADIYSLGCTLFYLIIGRPVYSGDTLMAKLLAHRDQPIPSLRALRSEVSASVDEVFQKMVAKNVADRYQSMGDVLAAIELCRADQPASRSLPSKREAPGDPELSRFIRNQSESDLPAAPRMSAHPMQRGRRGVLLWSAGALGGLALLGIANRVFQAPSPGKRGSSEAESAAPGERLERPHHQVASTAVPRKKPKPPPVNLIPQVDLMRDILHGKWERTGDGVRALAGGDFCSMQVTIALPDEYRVEVEFTSRAKSIGVVLNLPVGDVPIKIGIYEDWIELSCVDDEEGRLPPPDLPNPDHRPLLRNGLKRGRYKISRMEYGFGKFRDGEPIRIATDQRARVLVEVRRDDSQVIITAFVDGRLALDWTGWKGVLSTPTDVKFWGDRPPAGIAFGIELAGPVDFHSLTIDPPP